MCKKICDVCLKPAKWGLWESQAACGFINSQHGEPSKGIGLNPAEKASKALLSSSSRCPAREDRLHAAAAWLPTFLETPRIFVVASSTGPQIISGVSKFNVTFLLNKFQTDTNFWFCFLTKDISKIFELMLADPSCRVCVYVCVCCFLFDLFLSLFTSLLFFLKSFIFFKVYIVLPRSIHHFAHEKVMILSSGNVWEAMDMIYCMFMPR